MLREPSTTPRVAANSSLKTPWSWKKSRQKRYSEVAVSMSSLLRLRKSTYTHHIGICLAVSTHHLLDLIISRLGDWQVCKKIQL